MRHQILCNNFVCLLIARIAQTENDSIHTHVCVCVQLREKRIPIAAVSCEDGFFYSLVVTIQIGTMLLQHG